MRYYFILLLLILSSAQVLSLCEKDIEFDKSINQTIEDDIYLVFYVNEIKENYNNNIFFDVMYNNNSKIEITQFILNSSDNLSNIHFSRINTGEYRLSFCLENNNLTIVNTTISMKTPEGFIVKNVNFNIESSPLRDGLFYNFNVLYIFIQNYLLEILIFFIVVLVLIALILFFKMF